MTDEELRNKALRDGFLPAYRALEEAVDELDMDWSAHKPIQGERSTKVLTWRAIEAFYDAVLPGYTQRIQADQYTELQRMIVGVHVVYGRPDLFSVVVRADAWDAFRAAALAAPVEPDEVMTPGALEPIPPLETSAAWGDPAPPVEQP